MSKFWIPLAILAAGGVVTWNVATSLPDARVPVRLAGVAGAHGTPSSGARPLADPFRGGMRGVASLPTLSLPSTHGPLHAAATTGSFGFRYLGAFLPLGGNYTHSVAVGDVTGDKRQDLVVATEANPFDSNDRGEVSVFAQGPDGKLMAPVSLPFFLSDQPPLELGDLDHDGDLEIVVGHRAGITVLRYAAGALTGTEFRPPEEPGSVVTVNLGLMDVDVDGHLDVIAQSWDNNARVFFGNGAGGVARVETLVTPGKGFNVMRIGDVTGDGWEDIVMASGNGASELWVIPHNRSNGFLAPVPYALEGVEANPTHLAIGDFNNDHRMDVILAISSNDDSNLRVMYQSISGRLLAPVRKPTPAGPGAMVSTDFNGDQRADLVELQAGVLHYRQQSSTGGLVATSLPVDGRYLNPWAQANPMATGDLNGDGCKDVALADSGQGAMVYVGENCIRWTKRTGGGHQRSTVGAGASAAVPARSARTSPVLTKVPSLRGNPSTL